MNPGGEGRPTIDPHKGRLGRAAAAWGTPGHRAPQSLFSLLFQAGGGAGGGRETGRTTRPGPAFKDRPDELKQERNAKWGVQGVYVPRLHCCGTLRPDDDWETQIFSPLCLHDAHRASDSS